MREKIEALIVEYTAAFADAVYDANSAGDNEAYYSLNSKADTLSDVVSDLKSILKACEI